MLSGTPTHAARSQADPSRVDAEIDDLATAAERSDDARTRSRLHGEIVVLALPLADGIARRYIGRGIETDDLIQVARIGLVKAVGRYLPSRGCAFAAYATPSISGELKRWFRDHGWSVRPPRRIQELRVSVTQEEERIQRLLSRPPTEDELAAALDIERSELAEVRLCTTGYRALSLDGPNGSGNALVDQVLVADSAMDAWDTSDALGAALERLTDRQRLILRLRFAEDCTQSQIAERIGVSQMQVSRLLRAVLDHLREELGHTFADEGTVAV